MKLSKIMSKLQQKPEKSEKIEDNIQIKEAIQTEEKTFKSQKIDEAASKTQHFEIDRNNEKERAFVSYGKLITFLKFTFQNAKDTSLQSKIYEDAQNLCGEIIHELEKENEEILIMTTKTTYENYIFSHLANVCVLAIRVGLGLKYTKDKLIFLGISSLFHDIDKVHIDLTHAGNMKFKDSGKFVTELLIQMKDRKAQENGFENKELSEMAKIIGLLDIYEGLTHPRKLRERKLPHEVMRMFIETTAEIFEYSLVKKLIEELSIYPVGSFVKLNNDEIGQVIRVNKKFPTRPIVEILLDSNKNSLSLPKYVNLSENAVIQIKEAVDEDKIELPDKKLALKFKLQKWWDFLEYSEKK